MKRRASGLPFRNFTRFDFRGDDRDAERVELRRFFFAVDRAAERFEPFFRRRVCPPPRKPGNAGGG